MIMLFHDGHMNAVTLFSADVFITLDGIGSSEPRQAGQADAASTGTAYCHQADGAKM